MVEGFGFNLSINGVFGWMLSLFLFLLVLSLIFGKVDYLNVWMKELIVVVKIFIVIVCLG